MAKGRGLFGGWAMVAVFLLFYIFAFIDRMVITMMVAPLQRDLGLSDFQISLLMGPAFGLFFVACGLPMGWLVDRYSRRWISAISIIVWGIATCFCGIAGNFWQLAATRMGVGVGEAALTPAAHSNIAEQFPRRRLATALATYSLGAVIGGGLATAIGGSVVHILERHGDFHLPLIGHIYPWQMVFLVIGILTILLAPLALLVRERPRDPAPVADGHAESAGIIKLCLSNKTLFLGAPIGFGLLNVITNAYGAWLPTYFQRTHGWTIMDVGIALGVQHIIAAAIGQIGGAMLVDRLYARGMSDAHTRYQIWGIIVAIPLTVVALMSGNPWSFLLLNAPYYVLCYPFLGYAVASVQLHTPQHLRGRMSALFVAIISVIGTGIGAPATALITERLFADKAMIGTSLVVVSLIFTPLVLLVLSLVGRRARQTHARMEAVV